MTGLILTPEQQTARMTQLRAEVEDLRGTVETQAEALTAAEAMINDLQARNGVLQGLVDDAKTLMDARQAQLTTLLQVLVMNPETHVAKVQLDLRRRSAPISVPTAPPPDEVDGDVEDDGA